MPRRSAIFVLAPLLLAAAPAPPAPRPPEPPERIDDPFDGAALSPEWTWFHARYGWPDKVRSQSVRDGVLRIEPFHSAWVRDLQAPFLFRTVAGDFDIRARVRMKGREGPIAGGTWSLGGLMARVPNGLDSESWAQSRELALHHHGSRLRGGQAGDRDQGHLQQLFLLEAEALAGGMD